MCYCNYLNDREDYCGSDYCNEAAQFKGYQLPIEKSPVKEAAMNVIHAKKALNDAIKKYLFERNKYKTES